jgi:hypothetical protein
VRKALQTLPWVEKDSITPNLGKQQVSFNFKDKSDFKMDEVKNAIESNTRFKVGELVKGP